MEKVKIFDYCWHIPHQYDMINALKDDCEFYYCLNMKRHWDENVRPLPRQLKFVTSYEPGQYDVAVLHIDQQVIDGAHIKRRIYDDFNNSITDIPKIVINHGTPVFPEYYIDKGYSLSEKEMEASCREMVRHLVGGNTMVVNSFEAASEKEWGCGIPIVHGMNADEWWSLPKEPRVFTAISPQGFDVYYNRKCLLDVYEDLFDHHGYILAIAKVNIETDVSLASYKNYLGRSLVYFDPSFRTPMNRARTEAFLSGCCVVQVEGAHDLERWAKDGENIVLVPDDPRKIAAVIADLLENRYEEAVQIGENGRIKAMEMFSPQRYRSQWLNLIDQLTKRVELCH